MSAQDVVEAFCEAIGRKDLEGCRGLLAENVVYHNIPLDPIEGLEDTMATIQGMFTSFGKLEFKMLAIATAADGRTVLTERSDVFETGGHEVALPVMGAFEVQGGRIQVWRDYFDVGQAGRLMDPGAAQ
jgi:limonene-1,2-epoxide hydrolase